MINSLRKNCLVFCILLQGFVIVPVAAYVRPIYAPIEPSENIIFRGSGGTGLFALFMRMSSRILREFEIYSDLGRGFLKNLVKTDSDNYYSFVSE